MRKSGAPTWAYEGPFRGLHTQALDGLFVAQQNCPLAHSWARCEQKGRRVPGMRTTIQYTLVEQGTLILEPYPFTPPELVLSVEGRRLSRRRYASEAAFREAYHKATPKRMDFIIRPQARDATTLSLSP